MWAHLAEVAEARPEIRERLAATMAIADDAERLAVLEQLVGALE